MRVPWVVAVRGVPLLSGLAWLWPFLVGTTTALGGRRPRPRCLGAEDGVLGCEAGVLTRVIVQKVSRGGAECSADAPHGASWACRAPSPLTCSCQPLIVRRAR